MSKKINIFNKIEKSIIEEKLSFLEDAFKLQNGKIDGLDKQIKIILAEISILVKWINKHFDVELINSKSPVFKLIHDYDQVEELSLSLCLINDAEQGSQKLKEPRIYENDSGSSEKIQRTIKQTATSDRIVPKLKNNSTQEATSKTSGRGRPRKSPEEKCEKIKNREPVQCDQCGKVLKGPGSLRAHKQTHTNLRPHKCAQCGKAFRMKHHLDFHLLVHSGDKKESCSYCEKTFLVKRDLLRHERTHTGEKPFQCLHCPKSFNVKQHLTLHIRTHTGERPYKCSVCQKTFTQANSLRIHKKIHLTERKIFNKKSVDNNSSNSLSEKGLSLIGPKSKDNDLYIPPPPLYEILQIPERDSMNADVLLLPADLGIMGNNESKLHKVDGIINTPNLK